MEVEGTDTKLGE